MLIAFSAGAAETGERTEHFENSCPSHIREMLDENGYANAQVVLGASIEREAYDQQGRPMEVSTAFLITEQKGQRSLTGICWVIGTPDVHIESYGERGLDLKKAVSLTALIDGSSPINRRFALRMEDGSEWEFLSTEQSGWRVYRYTGPDGFACMLNGGRLRAGNHYYYLPHSGWLGNWPDLSLFPKSAEEASNFMGLCWEGISDRCLVWGANLRTEPTGSSKSLGKYHVALGEVLGEKPGKNQPWYHVRIGNAEGWMSGPYVVDPVDQEGFAFNGSLGIPWAEAQAECTLHASMDADDVLLTLPENTFMQVLAQTEDGWLHVLATGKPQDFSLSASGTYGYVSTDAAEIHSP